MADQQKTDGTTTARSSAPTAEPYCVGISPLVREQLDKIGINKEIKQRILSYLERKG